MDRREVVGSEAVGGVRMDADLDLGAAGAEAGGEAGGVVGRDDGIAGAVEKQDAAAGERAWGGVAVEHDHGAEQNGGGERRVGAELEQGGGDVGGHGVGPGAG